MQEIELKFQIPAGALDAVRQHLAALTGPSDGDIVLRAAYVDTPDRRLAAAHMALRVRQEGDAWVQTLKAGGSNTMMRLEDNQPVPPPLPGHIATADLSRHLGGQAEEALRRTLDWQPQSDPIGEQTGLVVLYRTDITRTRVQFTVGQGTLFEGVVELALDLGQIHAGALSIDVRELEIESVSGHPMAVITAGRDWVARHGLWLDTQTKAHRGDRLARQAAGQPVNKLTLGRPAKVKADTTLDKAWRAGLESCLAQIADNMSELGTAPAIVTDAAYQWRLGLRRLRAFGRLWSGSGLPFPHAAMDLAAALDRQLGPLRDHSLMAKLAKRLERIGASGLPLPAPPGDLASDTISLARSNQATSLCLDLLAALLTPPDSSQLAQAPLTPWLTQSLQRWGKTCRQAARHALDLNEAELHQLRKRAKRLRLIAAMHAPLWADKGQRRHERALKAALDALGQIQDETTALNYWLAHSAHSPQARLACDWLSQRRKGLRKRADRALQRWLKVSAPW
jgi:triphosphatase